MVYYILYNGMLVYYQHYLGSEAAVVGCLGRLGSEGVQAAHGILVELATGRLLLGFLLKLHGVVIVAVFVANSGLLVLLVVSHEILNVCEGLVELCQVHAFLGVPMDIGLGLQHLLEVVAECLEALRD